MTGHDPGAAPDTEELARVAASVQADWAALFAAREFGRLAALYAETADFWGSTATLFRGRAGIGEYFAGLPPGFKRAEFGTAAILPLAEGAFAASVPVTFTWSADGAERPLPYRMTQVFVQTAAGWKIAVHHASPVP